MRERVSPGIHLCPATVHPLEQGRGGGAARTPALEFLPRAAIRLDSAAGRGSLKAVVISIPETPATSTKMAEPIQNQSFRIERHGDIAVIIPSPEVEKLPDNLMEQAAH